MSGCSDVTVKRLSDLLSQTELLCSLLLGQGQRLQSHAFSIRVIMGAWNPTLWQQLGIPILLQLSHEILPLCLGMRRLIIIWSDLITSALFLGYQAQNLCIGNALMQTNSLIIVILWRFWSFFLWLTQVLLYFGSRKHRHFSFQVGHLIQL